MSVDLSADAPVSSAPAPRMGWPKRRKFTAEYKLAIVAQYDSLSEPGARRALLRQERLRTSHITDWRRAQEAGTLAELAASRPGRRPRKNAERVENERLRRENGRLQAELTRTRAALDVVGKAHALVGLFSDDADPSSERRPHG